MELEEASKVLETLYAGVNGYPLSLAERQRKGQTEWSLTYGEVVPEPFWRALSQTAPAPGEHFVDLGSGTGKAVFLAAALFDFAVLEGVELLEDLSLAAQAALTRYDAQLRPALPEEKQRQQLRFAQGDLLAYDLSKVDVVFTHAELFGRELLAKLGQKLGELKPGARVLAIGPPIPGPHLEVLKNLTCRMDWGVAAATSYRRLGA